MTDSKIKFFTKFKAYKLNWEKINNSVIKQNVDGKIVEVPFTDFDKVIYSGKGRITPGKSFSRVSFYIDSVEYSFFSDDRILNAIMKLVYDSVLANIDLNYCRMYFFDTSVFDTTLLTNFFFYSKQGILYLSIPSHSNKLIFDYLINNAEAESYSDSDEDLIIAVNAYREFYNQSEALKAKKISELVNPVDIQLLLHSEDYYRDHLIKKVIHQQELILRGLGIILIALLILVVFILFK